MEYNIATTGDFWGGGIFNAPKNLVERYIKLASEYQLKAILILLNANGVASCGEIAKILGITSSDVQDIMEFWVAENVVTCKNEQQDGISGIYAANYAAMQGVKSESAPSAVKESVKRKPDITPPVLTPADIVRAVNENGEIKELLNEAQRVLGRTISHAEEEMLVNLVNFYGMNVEIILMILGYCKTENDKGRKISTNYILKIAQNWIEEGIETIGDAEEKLLAIEQSDKLWNEIAAYAGIRHRNPTVKQRETVLGWNKDFSFEMICLAIDEMKDNTPAPSLPYVDKILKNWKKAGIKTPADAANEKAEFVKSREKKNTAVSKAGEITSKPTFDLEQIKKDAINNTEIKY